MKSSDSSKNTATVSISTLAEETGETVRSLQNWCDLGVLAVEPSTEKKGRGYHRIFRDDERKWALLASSLNKLRVPLGDIRKYLAFLRSYYRVETFVDHRNARRRFDTSPISRALTSDAEVFMMLSLQPNENGPEVKMSLLVPINEPLEPPACMRIVTQQIRFSRENPGCHFLNLTRIWAPLRK
jgi:DNA-binding transcriptional MerR regulator